MYAEAEAHKAKVRRSAAYALGQGDLSVIDAFIAPDESGHGSRQ